MSAKTNIRSFRYSDEIAAILEAQPGDSLNAKFEDLVRTCFLELEEKQKQLDRINELIKNRRRLLVDLELATEYLVSIDTELQAVKNSLDEIHRAAEAITDRL